MTTTHRSFTAQECQVHPSIVLRGIDRQMTQKFACHTHLGPFPVPCLGTPVLQFEEFMPPHSLCDCNRVICETCTSTTGTVRHSCQYEKCVSSPLASVYEIVPISPNARDQRLYQSSI